ncbi:hypothetical protein A3H10_01660 [Candidatus Uhrbacteria bacterium RIFCSPLOWO2_12_FULL_46_10]|uniref:Nucleotidyltransferase n=1 Tax=Candidatus Uhrbacteria bacterium RIFCSPLOWO2_01_FULL_47_25 TaxID=1802402 RepID=A0A1F7UTE4_9BACT|nr:MAG: hypothetical protein UX68_C0008G0049 [Parcubacteria group bacterium GW2011_GWA2_46_9]OGL60489.1 MAG: hypothetical protein A2752_05325 [Candidatus Uhrbacteria bacterium RIFCSPHIGHO2_01_FULL_46_23]OGL67821.1 MAG: hypothetical protein A3D60_01125 [Candidatus Uhrbacteria bacterium RIFCSPHIGHO2_02_FULL_47_29]OGL75531.1 MAG: hypothetical protein A3E96_03695 [Candidatus Uhrbacteria bacterium RIFCSPHIGHO2_12_FULL_46_13]OGL81562.1 MAG: hypothetical protein A2936_01845 [Candidatus Uhrbacteria bac
MHEEILTDEQKALLPVLKQFYKEFGLVGGTAIALHIGHRRSIDFDLFSQKKFGNLQLRKTISRSVPIEKELVNKLGEFTIFIRGVKITFYHFPFIINYSERLAGYLKLPNLLTLAAMKAYALGQRAKWKDYVDLYFILKQFYSISQIVEKTHQIFGSEFNEKLFRVQLAYFKDIDYSEKIEWMPGFEVDDAVVQKSLVEHSLGQ